MMCACGCDFVVQGCPDIGMWGHVLTPTQTDVHKISASYMISTVSNDNSKEANEIQIPLALLFSGLTLTIPIYTVETLREENTLKFDNHQILVASK